MLSVKSSAAPIQITRLPAVEESVHAKRSTMVPSALKSTTDLESSSPPQPVMPNAATAMADAKPNFIKGMLVFIFLCLI